jgi:uncharacterized coiled-coil protein SlyX
MASISQDSLISQIAELEATLATHDREQERVGIRLERLRNELAALNSEAQQPAPSLPSRASSMTPEE